MLLRYIAQFTKSLHKARWPILYDIQVLLEDAGGIQPADLAHRCSCLFTVLHRCVRPGNLDSNLMQAGLTTRTIGDEGQLFVPVLNKAC